MAEPDKHGPRANDPARMLPWLRSRSPVFADLDDRVAKGLFALSTLRVELRGTVLVEQGRRADLLFIVIEGALVTRVHHNGMVRELFSHAPGDVAGLLGMYDQEPAPYEIATVSNAQLVTVDLRKLWMYAAALHPMAMAIHAAFTPALAAQLADLDERAVGLEQRKNAAVHTTGEGFLRGELR